MNTKLIPRHILIPGFKSIQITDDNYLKLITDINQIIVDNKAKGSVKIVFTDYKSIDQQTIPDGHFFFFSTETLESVYKRFRKELQKTDYDVSNYLSSVSVYYTVFEITWKSKWS